MSSPQVIPAVFGHRGACGYRPENTLESFALAFDMGVNAVECDLLPTKDGQLVVLHDAELSNTTNVAQIAEFADRRRTIELPWRTLDGWFVQDFTADELRQLKAIERLPDLRPGSAKFDGQFVVPTLEEFLNADFAVAGRTLILEVKFAWLFKPLGLDSAALLVDALLASDWRERGLKLVIEAFEYDTLLAIKNGLASKNSLPVAGALEGLSFVLLTEQWRLDQFLVAETLPQFLARCAADFDGISFDHTMLSAPVPAGSSAQFGVINGLVDDARAAGLRVFTWTARAEEAQFSVEEYFQHFVDLNVDGIFADQPDLFVNFLRDAGLTR
jgi:glycerophosphoryl diester phosphodiesterase